MTSPHQAPELISEPVQPLVMATLAIHIESMHTPAMDLEPAHMAASNPEPAHNPAMDPLSQRTDLS